MKTKLFFSALAGSLIGCSSTNPPPTIVNVEVTDAPVAGSRYRSQERLRDVWIAPVAVGKDKIQHEHVTTFVEKNVDWELPNTMEPNAIDNPKIPSQEGDYDGEVLRRTREILADATAKIKVMNQQLESTKAMSVDLLVRKDTEIEKSQKELEDAKKQLSSSSEKLTALQQSLTENQKNYATAIQDLQTQVKESQNQIVKLLEERKKEPEKKETPKEKPGFFQRLFGK